MNELRFSYDPEVDILMVHFRNVKEGEHTNRSVEPAPGVIVDLDKDGNPIDIEVFNASRRYGKDSMERFDINTSLLTLTEAAERCGLSAETLKIQARNGRLRAQKVGRNWVTTESWLRKYLNERRYNAKLTAEM